MPVKNSVKRLREDVHKFIGDEDFDNAVAALREGLLATTTARKSRDDGQRGVQYVEKADHSTRLASARLLLEYGFGKPATRHDITVNDETQKAATPAEIMSRIASAGTSLGEIIEVYSESYEKEPLTIENT
jgi:hypothetical protein